MWDRHIHPSRAAAVRRRILTEVPRLSGTVPSPPMILHLIGHRQFYAVANFATRLFGLLLDADNRIDL